MASPTEQPFGTWASPITPERLTLAAVGLTDVQVVGGQVFWNETRPEEAGRYVLVGETDGEILPATFSARTKVHEYGGRCFAGNADLVVASAWADQQLWRYQRGRGTAPEALTTLPGARFADPIITPDGRWVLCVRETHGCSSDAGAVVNEIVAVPIGEPGAAPGEIRVLATGRDFYSSPRVSPSGDQVCWLSWDHPLMPWDGTELSVATFRDGVVQDVVVVAGGPSEAVTQPKYAPDGRLFFISDRSGWWNLYVHTGEGKPTTTVTETAAEFAGAAWVFGQSTYDFLTDGRLVATWGGNIGEVKPDGQLVPWVSSLSSFDVVVADGDSVVVIGGSPTKFSAVVRLRCNANASGSETVEVVIRQSRTDNVDAASVSVPKELAYPTGSGGGEETSYAWFYAPCNPAYKPPPGELPPVVVMSHGGPTSSASSVLKLPIQFWTSRGFAVADINYRGSTGKGRKYRDRLKGSWGITDVEDCSLIVAFLADAGLADRERAVIRGGSAGGFTTLACLAFTNVFAAGASLYGVGDLEMLAKDTHKFESRYLDGLVAPYPAGKAVYAERSPLNHVDKISCPIILFQGTEDKVVPREQADALFAALSERGIPVSCLMFEGEQHGFRKATTITAVAEAELAFYGRVLGFQPAGSPQIPCIVNAEKLPTLV